MYMSGAKGSEILLFAPLKCVCILPKEKKSIVVISVFNDISMCSIILMKMILTIIEDIWGTTVGEI